LVAKGDAQISALQSLGLTAGDLAIATAVYNVGNEVVQNTAGWGNAIYQQIANYTTWAVQSSATWSDAAIQSSAAWSNGIIQTIAGWSNAIASTIANYVSWSVNSAGFWGDAIVSSIYRVGDFERDNTAAWGNAICGTIGAWGNAEVANGNNNAVNTIRMLDQVSNSITNSIFAADDINVAAIYGSASNQIGATYSSSNAVIGAIGSMSVANIGATFGAANSIVAQVAANDNGGGFNTINGTLVWSINNLNDRSNEHLNKLQEILNNMISWNQNLWAELHVIHEYMQLLTEVTIQFDEFMAGAQGANTDAMNSIQDALRRQAFG
jgi:hypothetical protein